MRLECLINYLGGEFEFLAALVMVYAVIEHLVIDVHLNSMDSGHTFAVELAHTCMSVLLCVCTCVYVCM